MKIIIIPLAAKKVVQRKISREMIYETINHPDQTVEGYCDRTVSQKVYIIDNKKKLLRVVYEENGKGITVVTTYLTSQIKKYWR